MSVLRVSTVSGCVGFIDIDPTTTLADARVIIARELDPRDTHARTAAGFIFVLDDGCPISSVQEATRTAAARLDEGAVLPSSLSYKGEGVRENGCTAPSYAKAFSAKGALVMPG